MDAAFEIAISAEHRDGNHVVVFDGCADGVGQRAAIADAGGAAVTHQMEIQFIEIRRKAGGLQDSQ